MKSGPFQIVPQKQFWKRVSFPAGVLWGASCLALRDSISGAFSEWANIPASCTADFPASGALQIQCDQFWKAALSHAVLAMMPVALGVFALYAIHRAQIAFYKKAHQRISSSKADFSAVRCANPARPDLFSWLYCLQPVQVECGGEKFVVYLSSKSHGMKDSALAFQESGPERARELGQEWGVYELGVFFARPRRVAVKRIQQDLGVHQRRNNAMQNQGDRTA